jgi:TrmH family RNA methyltransferase
MFSSTALSTAKLKQFRKLKQKKYRNQYNCFLCEGFRLFDAAIGTANLVIREIIISEKFKNTKQGNNVRENAGKRGINLYLADDLQMRTISEEVTPPGIVFITEKKQNSYSLLENLQDKFIIYLDKISDPGNFGTILRSACWFGVHTILLSPESVDPWNSKSVRASAGAIFKANIFTELNFNHLQQYFRPLGYKFIATVVSDGIALDKWKIDSNSILFLGQEAEGLSKEIVKHADVHINVPGYGNVESLNLSVATGIILYEATKPDSDE